MTDPTPTPAREWAYRYVDNPPGSYSGPVSEQFARNRAANDLSVIVLYRDSPDGAWIEVDQDARLRAENELLRWLHAEACWHREEMARATALLLVAQRDGLAEVLGLSARLPMDALLRQVRMLRKAAAATRHHQQQHAEAVRELERVRADRDALLNDRARIRDLWEHGQLHDAIAAMGFNPDELRDPRPAGTGPCPTCRRYPNGTRWEPQPGELVTGNARHPYDPDPVGKYIETRAGTAIIDTVEQQRKIHGLSVLGAMSYVDAHTLRPVAERDPMMGAEVAPHDPEMHATEIGRINCDTCNPPLPPAQPAGQPR
ncbi:hypothetical protein ABZ215_13695 [Amycolatopsis sp. NPDC006131]|uniref:hypothetical protein n=1 Tax=Amycolatopsis sp. NPDC006131 TaxID=3156731 RepID=UPI0033A1975B